MPKMRSYFFVENFMLIISSQVFRTELYYMM